MIRKNGGKRFGGWELDLGSLLQVVVILITMVTLWASSNSKMENRVDQLGENLTEEIKGVEIMIEKHLSAHKGLN